METDPMLDTHAILDKHAIAENVANALRFGQRYTEPYLMYQYSPFSPALYAELVRHLPEDDSQWVASSHPDAIMPSGKRVRFLLPLTAPRLTKVKPETRDFWLEFAEAFRSDELRDVYKEFLEPDLKKRWTCPLSEIVALPKPCLMRDYPGYSIRPHPDSSTKVMTTQYYLPADESQSHLGTSFYIRKGPGNYETVRKAEFLPNRAYCFAVGDKSFHGVEVVSEKEKARNSLIMIYFKEEGHEY
jgi:hypothetical protein